MIDSHCVKDMQCVYLFMYSMYKLSSVFQVSSCLSSTTVSFKCKLFADLNYSNWDLRIEWDIYVSSDISWVECVY